MAELSLKKSPPDEADGDITAILLFNFKIIIWKALEFELTQEIKINQERKKIHLIIFEKKERN